VSEPISESTQTETGEATKRSLNPFALGEGLIALAIAAYILTGGRWLDGISSRWILAGGALVVGLILLLASLRTGRKRNQ
jgi:hypothetical protein